MVVLKQNNEKLKAYNQRMIELATTYPEDAEYFHTIEGIAEAFTPYANWIESFTDEDKKELKVVPDKNLDFAGVYICADHNDHYNIERLTDYKEDDSLYDYGVVDNATQIFENCEIPENAVVLMVPIIKSCESEFGWRWHKWGPYYGIQNHQCEYLYDEEEVEMIYCFSVVTLRMEGT